MFRQTSQDRPRDPKPARFREIKSRANRDSRRVKASKQACWFVPDNFDRLPDCLAPVDRVSTSPTVARAAATPKFARAMFAFFDAEANRVARRITTCSAKGEKQFLEVRAAQDQADLDDARELRDFREVHKVVDLRGPKR